ncbi:MAG TPA: ATP-binding protein [Gammaproteobacteria bacterium]|jgi:hypothetical protein|nr:ATP-binding protein [Gammaproteobacteria bacterium]
MLYEFLTTNKATLIDRCRQRVAERAQPPGSVHEVEHGIPLFLDQLIRTLAAEEACEHHLSVKVSGASGGKVPERSEIGASATRHGRALSMQGFSFDQVVRSYGDMCQAITELATEAGLPMEVTEFKTLNRCLDNAIADAVTEFAYQQQSLSTDKDTQVLDERLEAFLGEMRGHLQSASLAVAAIKAGRVGLNGVTGNVLDLSLAAMGRLMQKPLSAVKPSPHLSMRYQPISVADFIMEVKTFCTPEAGARRCGFSVPDVDTGLEVNADRDVLFSVVGSLLENAFRYTQPQSEVILTAYSAGDHILIEVEDNCGGLAPGVAERLFLLPQHARPDRPAFRYGLPACRRNIEQNGGTLKIRNIPGTGCVFTITLPRRHPYPADSRGE